MGKWAVGGFALMLVGCGGPGPGVTLYCAQDREFAESLLADFAARGTPVVPKYDTEAAKTIGLAEDLLAERHRPRCDVHWNNEILATIRLARAGVYEPYDSPAAAAFPASCRPPDRAWTAFAARARVLLVNTDLVPPEERPASLLDLAEPRPSWRGKVAMAKPMFGTTATQAACLWEVLGADAARAYYLALRDGGLNVVAGNKQAAVGVGAGRFAVCVTDTDDAQAEVDAGRPVAVIFPDRDGHPKHPRMGTLFIPNTVAVVRGGPNPTAARALVDFLLAPESEARLAAGAGRQIPLNPTVTAALPATVPTPKTVRAMDVDFGRAADAREESQRFLAETFAR